MTKLAAGLTVFVLTLMMASGVARADKRETLHAGTWSKKTYDVSGSYRIVTEGGVRYLELSKDFATKNGPDLKIFLSPRALGDVKSSNAMAKALRVGRLAKHKGKQRIALPKTATLASYKSILIHCEKYTVLFAAAAL